MSVMNVDYEKLRIILTPHVLRQGGVIEAAFKACYAPLKTIYNTFATYEAKEEAERSYGPTVKQLRQAIADHLGISASRVIFGDVANRDVVDLRRQSDAASTRVALRRQSDAANTRVALWSDDMVWWNREFTVSLPSAYTSNENEIKAILDRWKMAASRYTIIYRQRYEQTEF